MAAPRESIFTTKDLGNTGSGSRFDKPSLSGTGNVRIKKIDIWQYNGYVTCLKVYYQDGSAFEHGQFKNDSPREIKLGDEEYITVLEGEFGGLPLSQFKLTTSKGNDYGPFGSYYSGASKMVWDVSSFVQDPTTRNEFGLLCFAGTCDSTYIYSLSATFVNYAKAKYKSPVIKYERRAHTSTGASENLETLSQFACNLMSPIVTLVVGPSKTEFFVYERVISRIPFFAAALDGRFSEAFQKKIVMPGENPESVAALIEFLYTGHYTYPYTCEDMSSKLDVPKADRAEGVFHIGVYVVGDKYDCEELSKAAMVGIVNAMSQLSGIECMRFWSEIYLSGLSVDLLKDFPGLAARIVKILREVYAEHGEEMATIVKGIPELGNDFLKLSLEYCKI